MKRKTQRKIVTMMAACAIVANTAYMQQARAQGMPDEARQRVDTMRPMYVEQSDDNAYGDATPATDAGARRDSASQ